MMDRVDLDLNNYNLKQECLEKEWEADCQNKRDEVLQFVKNIIQGETSTKFNMIFVDWIKKAGLEDPVQISAIKRIIWLFKYAKKSDLEKNSEENKQCLLTLLNFSCRWLFNIELDEICSNGDGYLESKFVDSIWKEYAHE